jgi:hypothetical protein
MKYTETTAKKGMVKYKKGHSKLELDYGFLNEINYDDKRQLKEVVETLFGKIKELEKLNKSLEETFKNRVDQLEKEFSERLERIEQAFEQNIKEWLSV